MRGEKAVALFVLLVWSYLLLAVLVNPTFSALPPPANPVMPFLSAAIVSLLWPIVLVLVPIVMFLGRRLVQAPTGTRRGVSSQEFTRIQARAHAASARDRQGARLPEPSASQSAARETFPARSSGRVEPEPPFPEEATLQEETSRTAPPKVEGAEFTPPPMSPRSPSASEGTVTTSTGQRKINEPTPEAEIPKAELEVETKKIEELEADKSAVVSLMNRLEEMNASGSMKPELYEKLKRKYSAEIEKISEKIRDLSKKGEPKRKVARR